MAETPFSLLPWLGIIFLIVVFVMAAWAFIVWWKKDRHTRERFAFSGFWALLGVGFFFLTSLIAKVSILDIVVSYVLKPFGVERPISPMSPVEAECIEGCLVGYPSR